MKHISLYQDDSGQSSAERGEPKVNNSCQSKVTSLQTQIRNSQSEIRNLSIHNLYI
jgi:hypothetical protein